MRLIDADALYLRMAGHGWWNNTDRDIALDVLERMPTIDPDSMRPQWIPVTERLPEDDTMMLVTCRTKRGWLNVNRAYYFGGSWHGSGSMSGVIAWMPLPEPYKSYGSEMNGGADDGAGS
ncbi:MAG: DUF551 domain-containing protein [Butyricicoccus sp.]